MSRAIGSVRPGLRTSRASGRDLGLPVILLYHRVADVDSDPWGLAVSPANFREQMRVLGAPGLGISLTELMHGLSTRHVPFGKICVTFDDGYADNLLNAKPILEECAVPATFFLTTGNLEGNREFWWDALERPFFRARRLPAIIDLRSENIALTFDLGEDAEYRDAAFADHRKWRAWDPPPSRRHRAYHELWQALLALPSSAREAAVNNIQRWADNIEAPTESRPLTTDQVRQLASGSLVEIGGHTVTHPCLPRLDRQEQAGEIVDNKIRLETLLDQPLRHFAYPHGQFNHDTIALLREAGYHSACTTSAAAVTAPAEVFRLPRIRVADWTGAEFSRRLRQRFAQL